MSFLYVIADHNDGPCKIGYSVDPARRVRQLQTGHAKPLALHHFRAVDPTRVKMMERLIHDANRHHRLKGEWFTLSVDDAIAEVEFACIRYEEEPNLKAFR